MAAPRWTPRSIAAWICACALRRCSSRRPAGACMKSARTSTALRRDSTSASRSAQNNAKNKPSRRLKKQNEGTEAHSPAHQRSDSVHCERASAASSSSEVSTALTVANSSRASWSRVGTPQEDACWACPYPDVEMTPRLRQRRWEGARPPLLVCPHRNPWRSHRAP
jgi:hypothetical protein